MPIKPQRLGHVLAYRVLITPPSVVNEDGLLHRMMTPGRTKCQTPLVVSQDLSSCGRRGGSDDPTPVAFYVTQTPPLAIFLNCHLRQTPFRHLNG